MTTRIPIDTIHRAMVTAVPRRHITPSRSYTRTKQPRIAPTTKDVTRSMTRYRVAVALRLPLSTCEMAATPITIRMAGRSHRLRILTGRAIVCR